jgi:uncharacterized protein (TIGR03000 family)
MKTKICLLALASCLELAVAASSARAQVYYGPVDPWRRTGDYSGIPGYYYAPEGSSPAVLGSHGAGVYNRWGTRIYGLPDYGAAMEMYGYPVPVYPPYSPYGSASAYAHRGGVVDPSITGAPITTNIAAAPPASAGAAQPSQAAAGTAADKAQFHVKVPVPNAKVFFNDKLIEQQGTDRKLMTPALQPGPYSYRVRANWTENGVDKSQEQAVTVEPGKVVNLTFGENRVQ